MHLLVWCKVLRALHTQRYKMCQFLVVITVWPFVASTLTKICTFMDGESVSALWKEVKQRTVNTSLLCSDLFRTREEFDLNLSDLWYAPWPVHIRRVSPSGLLEILHGVQVEKTQPAVPRLHCRNPPPSVLGTQTHDLNANKNIQTLVFLHTDNSDGMLTKPSLHRWRAQIFADECGLWVTACAGMFWIRLQTPRYSRDHRL